jgi:hypothetical protein
MTVSNLRVFRSIPFRQFPVRESTIHASTGSQPIETVLYCYKSIRERSVSEYEPYSYQKVFIITANYICRVLLTWKET